MLCEDGCVREFDSVALTVAVLDGKVFGRKKTCVCPGGENAPVSR